METIRQTDAHPDGSRGAGCLRLKGAAWLAAAAAVILFVIPAGKPLYLDNMDFPAVAKATAETGIPVYYRGEDNPRHLGLYHPPLYIYALAGWFRLWGYGEVQARLFGLACALLHGWIVLYGIRLLMGGAAVRRTAPWFWALWLLNPYTLQSAAVTDIDTTVYGPLLLGLLVAALRMSWEDGRARQSGPEWADWALLAVLMALALWAKLTTALSLAPAAAALLAGRMGWRRAILHGGGALAAGAALFLASYALYGRVTGLDIGYTFEFTMMSFLQRGTGGSFWEWLAAHGRTFADMALWQVKWSGLAPWAACAAAAAWLCYRGIARGEARMRDGAIVLLWALLVTGFYCGLTYTFGRAPFKYVYPAWGAVTACLAVLAGNAWDRLSSLAEAPRRRMQAAGALLFISCFVLSAGWLRDRAVLEGSLSRADAVALALPAAGVLAGMLAWRSKAAGAALMLSVLAYEGVMAGIALAMARAPYPTTYNYGQMGFDETVCFLQQHTGADEAIVAMKDAGYRAGRRYYENYHYIYSGPEGAGAMGRILAEGKARYAVFTEGNGQDWLALNPALQNVIETMCRLERSYGHYRIYLCGQEAAAAGSDAR